MELSVDYWAQIGSSSDHMIILLVRPRSWIAGVSVVDSFEFCSIYLSHYRDFIGIPVYSRCCHPSVYEHLHSSQTDVTVNIKGN